MPDDPRVQRLLEELLESQSTPEKVCGSCVELLPVIRERWHQMSRARAELDAMFPPAPGPGESLPERPTDDESLPQIPGYAVESVLGRGGMGIVFRARHLRLNRLVALKTVLAGLYAGAHERKRFQREAEAVAGLQHPNVVQIHDVGDSNGRPYFTMEFVEGGSLAQKLSGAPLPAREAAQLVATLAGAVHAAHGGGIVHRDLKPANVLLTPDGTPKISDFGLARRLGGEIGLTRTGTAVGTPSYMAPEQAQGAADAAGPPADIYALGAILYELLTGRPPFRAETAAETVHQLLTEDPVPPSRLNSRVPRDLETICLKCLQKECRFRYTTSSTLAEDLDRYLRGEAILARPQNRLGRLIRRIRRRPLLAAAIAVATISTFALLGGGAWALSERAATTRATVAAERAADDDLGEMEGHLKKSYWPEAKAALERSKGRLGNRRPDHLRARLDQGACDLELGQKLEVIRLELAKHTNGILDPTPGDAEYDAVFRAAGFAQTGEDASDNSTDVAARMRTSNISSALLAALDHWSICTHYGPRQRWALKVASALDPMPSDWSKSARDPNVRRDHAALTKLIVEAPVGSQSVSLLLALDSHFIADGNKHSLPFLTRVQQAHPDDLWANLTLGVALRQEKNPAEALRYFQVVIALRPHSFVGYQNLGMALANSGRFEEAAGLCRQALACDATPGPAHLVLAPVLSELKRHQEALEVFEAAHRYRPNSGIIYTSHAGSLEALGRFEEAFAKHQQAVALEPTNFLTLNGMRHYLLLHGRAVEARVFWGRALETAPRAHGEWYGYAELCLFLGQENEYRRARQALLATFGNSTDPYIAERTSRACLLLPAAGDELRLAVELARRAAAVERSENQGVYPYFQFVQGLAEYRQGHSARAIAIMRGDASRMAGPSPRLVLAMALHQSGQPAEARKMLKEAILAHDWRANNVRDQDGWIYHVLRREAESMILPSLPAFLEGTYQPRDNDERFAFMGVCQFTNRNRELVRLYTDIFAADPILAGDRNAAHRYNAARAAALAGCGKNAVALSEAERAQLRRQARNWLRAEVALYRQFLDSDFSNARDGVRDKVTRLRDCPDLAGLHSPAELERWSADERNECNALWNEMSIEIKRTDKNGK